jgi:hypothetical protein
MKQLLLIMFILSLTCCETKTDCELASFRCEDNVIEVCTKTGFETVMDCDNYETKSICVLDTDGEFYYCEEVL